MNERLKEIKEKIASFVNDYDVVDFYVYIDDGVTINSINDGKPLPSRKDVIIEVRV